MRIPMYDNPPRWQRRIAIPLVLVCFVFAWEMAQDYKSTTGSRTDAVVKNNSTTSVRASSLVNKTTATGNHSSARSRVQNKSTTTTKPSMPLLSNPANTNIGTFEVSRDKPLSSVFPPPEFLLSTSSKHNHSDAFYETNKNFTSLPLIAVQLSGEMANLLFKIIHGRCLQWRLWERYGLASRLMLKPQRTQRGAMIGKTPGNEPSIHRCWPQLRGFSFLRDEAFVLQQEELQLQAKENPVDLGRLELVNSASLEVIDQGLDYFVDLVSQRYNESHLDGTNHSSSSISMSKALYSPVAVLPSASLAVGELFGEYYYQLREFLRYDEANPSCCAQRAQPDETVLHIRNFVQEMPRVGVRLGFQEMEPWQMVDQLIVPPNSSSRNSSSPAPKRKLAIVGRLWSTENSTLMGQVVERAKNASWSVRLISDIHQQEADSRGDKKAPPLYDFCFMASASTLIGTARSTYVWMAALLGNATQARLYLVHAPPNTVVDRVLQDHAGWRLRNDSGSEALQERVHIEIYNETTRIN